MAASLLDFLKCPVCLEYCVDPVETQCCHKLLCKQCMENVDSKCVYCRVKCLHSSSIIATRMINSLPYECEYCKLGLTRGDRKDHALKCTEATIDCTICKLKCEKSKILNHLLESHDQDMLKHINIILDNLEGKCTIKNNDAFTIESQRNSNGKVARLGQTGKYYCGSRLDGPRCVCCNGICGPSSSCNCSFCMELDIKGRSLPKGWLVNSSGFNARKHNAHGIFYCGRKVLDGVANCDGYCGPTNGPNCDDCKKLDRMSTNRYSRLLN